MAQIFLSYKREEREHARRLATALIAEGYSVWWDVELLPGEDFIEETTRVLDISKAVIVLWSHRSAASLFVRAEARRALYQGKLIPIRLDDVVLPLPFDEIQSIDFRHINSNWQPKKYKRVLDSISKKAGLPKNTEVEVKEVKKKLSEEVLWKAQWAYVRDTLPKDIKAFKLFIDQHANEADDEIVAVAKRRIEELSNQPTTWPYIQLLGITIFCSLLIAVFYLILTNTVPV